MASETLFTFPSSTTEFHRPFQARSLILFVTSHTPCLARVTAKHAGHRFIHDLKSTFDRFCQVFRPHPSVYVTYTRIRFIFFGSNDISDSEVTMSKHHAD